LIIANTISMLATATCPFPPSASFDLRYTGTPDRVTVTINSNPGVAKGGNNAILPPKDHGGN
jgi:hypothetical protein